MKWKALAMRTSALKQVSVDTGLPVLVAAQGETMDENIAVRAQKMWPIGWEAGWCAGVYQAQVGGYYVEVGESKTGEYLGHVRGFPDHSSLTLWGLLCELRGEVIARCNLTKLPPLPELVPPTFTEAKNTTWALVLQCLPAGEWQHDVSRPFKAVRKPSRGLELYYTLHLALEGGALRLQLLVSVTSAQTVYSSTTVSHEDNPATVREVLQGLFLSLAGLPQTAGPLRV
jgi:hypothetical protein